MSDKRIIKILYIEDDEDDFFLASEFLDDIAMGVYQIDWAPSYGEGLEAVLAKDHDICLVDFRLGQESGLDLIKQARLKGIGKPIILMTGLGDREIDMAAMEAGADDYISKVGLNGTILERAIRYSINQRITTERMLESEQRLRDYVETASDWFWEMDENFRYTNISEKYHRSIGLDVRVFIGKTREEISIENTDDKKWRQYFADMDSRKPFRDFTFELKTPDGSRMVARTNGKPVFDKDGEFCGYIGTATNITEQKIAEESRDKEVRFRRQLLKNTQEGYWHIDSDGMSLDVNPAMCRILGRKREDIIGRPVYDFFDAQNAKSFEVEILEGNQDKRGGFEIVLQRPDGSKVPCINNATTILDDKGTKVGSVGMYTDVSQQKEVSLRLEHALDEAERANKSKSEFLASMSHELRTPLNAILGFAQMLQFNRETKLSPDQNTHVENILAGGNHLLELVNKILDLAKIEADQVDLDLDDVNANEIVADSIALTIPLGEVRNIQVIDEFSNTAAVQLRTDRIRLKQILLNLLSNAVKFNEDGGTITVKGAVTDDNYLRISVTDTGIGMEDKDHSGVFKMFHRLGADSMVTREGTGIGLTVTKLLVERLAGRIGIESEKGVGSTFWFELPEASNDTILIWTDALRVGIDAIDHEHQVLYLLTNMIMNPSINEKELEDMIVELIRFIKYHNIREEAIMEVCGCPDMELHVQAHRKFDNKIEEVSRLWCKTHDPELLGQFRQMLREWLAVHVEDDDIEISHHLEGKKEKILQVLDGLGPMVSISTPIPSENSLHEVNGGW